MHQLKILFTRYMEIKLNCTHVLLWNMVNYEDFAERSTSGRMTKIRRYLWLAGHKLGMWQGNS
jgi:hypothetical protein